MTVPSTLQAIRTKTRKLVGSPSPTRLTDASLDEYINTFYQYDMPAQLRLFDLHQPYIFYTQPNVDAYHVPLNNVDATGSDPAFRTAPLTLNPPIYIAGYYSFWSQSQEQFYRVYPQLNNIQQVATGDGTSGPYTFTIPDFPFLRGYETLTFNPPPVPIATDVPQINSNVLISADTEIARDDGNGGWLNEIGEALTGTVNYVNGQCVLTFENAIPQGTVINAQTVPYEPARPQGALYYNDTLFLRPVPDQVYKVEVQSYRSPVEFLSSSQSPLLDQWWQYIAFGAAKKILEDRLDTDGWMKIQPFFDEQERLVLRRTLVQQTPERTATIYTEMTQWPAVNAYNRF